MHKETRKPRLVTALSATLLTTALPANANSVQSGTPTDHLEAKVEKGMRVHGEVESALSSKPLLASSFSLHVDSFGIGIKTTSEVFASFKKELLLITEHTSLSGAVGGETFLADIKRTFKPGILLILEQDFGPLQIGGNAGVAYHFGTKSLYPAFNLYATMQLGNT